MGPKIPEGVYRLRMATFGLVCFLHFFSPISPNGTFVRVGSKMAGNCQELILFAFRPITPLQFLLKVIRVCHLKSLVLRFQKCNGFLFYISLNQNYGCSKSAETEIFSANKLKFSVSLDLTSLDFEQP